MLHELTPVHASLEDAFMSLTKDSVEFQNPETEAQDATVRGPPLGTAHERDDADHRRERHMSATRRAGDPRCARTTASA